MFVSAGTPTWPYSNCDDWFSKKVHCAMKSSIIAIALCLCATSVTAAATAATYVYTFDDMTWVANQAKDTFCVSRYYEYGGPDRWGVVWEKPYNFSTSYPSNTQYSHFHIGFKGNSDCYNTSTQGMGKFVNGVCTALDPNVNRGHFSQHAWDHQLFFEIIAQNNSTVPFMLKTIDIYDAEDEYVSVYVRGQSGKWYWWQSLNGAGAHDDRTYRRWSVGAAPEKEVAVAWKRKSGTSVTPPTIGRIEVTD